MTDSYTIFLIYLSAVILLPIVPAAILYRLIPAEASAEGTLYGVRFKLGGAFAGYFMVMVVIIFAIDEPRNVEVWTLHADYEFSDGAGSAELINIRTIPKYIVPTQDGRLKYKIIRAVGSDGNLVFPDLEIGHENYVTESILLDDHNMNKDDIRIDPSEKALYLSRPIRLARETEHN